MRVTYASVAEFKKILNPAKRPTDGYGKKIPTDWQVRLNGETRFRKVYAICFSNAASFYVPCGKSNLYIRSSDFPN